jgi:hypothetical protein
MTEVASPSYAEIWTTLSKIDVSKHVEKKNGLSYLSWAWAWGVLMQNYPQAEYSFTNHEHHSDGTVTVHCDVMIGQCHREMWLPVMDHRNNAIKNPDARKISDTKMRCLVKTLAMFGLGFALYAGEDLPEPEVEVKPEPKATPKNKKADIPNEAAAEEVVAKILEFATQMCSDPKGLRSFWSENKQVIDLIDQHYPKQFEQLKKGFTDLKSKFGGNND